MERRNFFKVIGGGAALVAVSPAFLNGVLYADNSTMLYKAYNKVQLVDEAGKPIKASDLQKETPYIFNYPHASTPCMIINLPESTQTDVALTSENKENYVWKSGVGADRTIVAYVAICTHQLTHPNKKESFITYVPKAGATAAYDKGGVIVCSSHMSAFDSSAGAKVLGGPASQPLNAVVLEHAADDTLWACGILGKDKFQQYFSDFKSELKEYYKKPVVAQKIVSISAPTTELKKYTKEIVQY